jgi:hypothetical protein
LHGSHFAGDREIQVLQNWFKFSDPEALHDRNQAVRIILLATTGHFRPREDIWRRQQGAVGSVEILPLRLDRDMEIQIAAEKKMLGEGERSL